MLNFSCQGFDTWLAKHDGQNQGMCKNIYFYLVFRFSLHWPLGRFSNKLPCQPVNVCKPCFRVDRDFWLKSVLLISEQLNIFFYYFVFQYFLFWSLQTSLLCIGGELAGKGPGAHDTRVFLLQFFLFLFPFSLFWFLCYYPHLLRYWQNFLLIF